MTNSEETPAKNVKILFLDESISQKNSFIIVGGFFCDAKIIFEMEKEIAKILNDNSMKDLKNLKERNFDPQKRLLVNRQISNVMRKYGARILCAAVLKKSSFLIKVKDEYISYSPFLDGSKLVLERFHKNLTAQDTGFVFYDTAEDKAHLLKILEADNVEFKHTKYLFQIPTWTSTDSLKTKIYSFCFLDDLHSLGIRLADLICGVLQKAVDNFAKECKLEDIDQNLENLNKKFYALNEYWDLFVRSSAGKITGYGIKTWR